MSHADNVDGGGAADDGSFDYNPGVVLKSLPVDPGQALELAGAYFKIFSNQSVMGGVETVLRESYKFIRLADDLHDIKWYLNDIRVCFIALTISGYVGVLLYGLMLCFSKRRKSNNNRRGGGAYGGASRRPVDEEMNVGGGYDAAMYKPLQANAFRQSTDAQIGRYGPRSMNRNLQTSGGSGAGVLKLDNPADSPSKKHLLENHTAAVTGGAASQPSPGQYGGGYNTTSTVTGPDQISPMNRENGGLTVLGQEA